ncbi:hypothetical protein RIF29_15215 [Crotalaria pallida]|uniref:Uncharacterized protein n=1 Tax=Crotalaria pallida TaxID=3830 RepID=A0AAN9FJR4_CROPI
MDRDDKSIKLSIFTFSHYHSFTLEAFSPTVVSTIPSLEPRNHCESSSLHRESFLSGTLTPAVPEIAHPRRFRLQWFASLRMRKKEKKLQN